jgi:hypothetical protein
MTTPMRMMRIRVTRRRIARRHVTRRRAHGPRRVIVIRGRRHDHRPRRTRRRSHHDRSGIISRRTNADADRPTGSRRSCDCSSEQDHRQSQQSICFHTPSSTPDRARASKPLHRLKEWRIDELNGALVDSPFNHGCTRMHTDIVGADVRRLRLPSAIFNPPPSPPVPCSALPVPLRLQR